MFFDSMDASSQNQPHDLQYSALECLHTFLAVQVLVSHCLPPQDVSSSSYPPASWLQDDGSALSIFMIKGEFERRVAGLMELAASGRSLHAKFF